MNIDNVKPGEFVEVTKAELDAINKKRLDDYERLIAAAPDLLRWLQFAVKVLRPMYGHTYQFEQMEAAVFKATGAQS